VIHYNRSPSIVAVVPVKNLADAKQRLSPFLSPSRRRGLYREMLLDVLTTLKAVSALAGVMLVTRDHEVREFASPFADAFLEEPGNDGHSTAVTRAACALVEAGVDAMLQVPGDVPLMTPADVNALLQAHGEAPAVTITPSQDYRGSNALLVSPPDCLPFAFGSDSFYPHLRVARERGIEPVIVERPGLALDIDEPDDLHRFAATPSTTRAYAWLRETGVLDELQTSTVAGPQ